MVRWGGITVATRKSIINLFVNGFSNEYSWEGETVIYPYYGKLSEIDFLSKVFPLDDIPSIDTKFPSAKKEIEYKIENDLWEYGCVFYDQRFNFLAMEDNKFLDLLCIVFDPDNRIEDGYWFGCLKKINLLLKRDCFELYQYEVISGYCTYSWREITKREAVEGNITPFSIRFNKEIQENKININLSKEIRKEIFVLVYNQNESITVDYIGFPNFNTDILDAFLNDIRKYHEILGDKISYNGENMSDDSNQLEDLFFCDLNPWYTVFDAIELYAQYKLEARPNKFSELINLLFEENNINYRLRGGKFEISHELEVRAQTELTKEKTLKELLEETNKHFRSNNISDKQIALEKLWDAFERLKTSFSDNKKESVAQLISKMSLGNDDLKIRLDNEFNLLTEIGNNYQIRHHESGKKEIPNINYYTYFFHRCVALVNLALNYVD